MEEPSPDEAIAFEAEQVVKELAFGVDSIEISTSLPRNRDVTYLNLLTKEKEAYCVELSTRGYRVVAQPLLIPHCIQMKLLLIGRWQGFRYQ